MSIDPHMKGGFEPVATVDRDNDHIPNNELITTGSSDLVHAEAVFAEATEANTTAQPSTSTTGINTNGITWTDQYYANEPSIVAVFDIDSEMILNYQNGKFRESALKLLLNSVCLALGAAAMFAVDLDFFGFVFISIWFFMLRVSPAGQYLAKLKVIKLQNNIHMALTTDAVRYDQDRPMVRTSIPLSRITRITVAQASTKSWGYFGEECSVYQIEIHIHGSLPKIYLGVQNPEAFQRLIMAQQRYNTQHNVV